MRRDVDDVLQSLIEGQVARRERHGEGEMGGHHLTTLGVPLEACDDGSCRIDVTNLVFFEGLSTFVTLLANDVIEQCGFGVADIMVKRRVDRSLTPDFAKIGIEWVMVYIRMDAAEHIPWHHRSFLRSLQTVFGAIQTARWGGILFPEFFGNGRATDSQGTAALLFPFHLVSGEEEHGYFILLEYGKAGHFLRITVEDARQARLYLKHIPHRVVDNLDRQHYLRNIGYNAEQIAQGILQECRNHRTEYKETPDRQTELFEHLAAMGLSSLQSMVFRWPSGAIREILGGRAAYLSLLIGKVLFILEDPEVMRILCQGSLVEMVSSGDVVYLDASRRGICLNVSYGERRIIRSLQYYLEGMPPLRAACRKRAGALKGMRVLLIHHITGEVLGLMHALEILGAERITTLFVAYAGIVPDAYLETLLSLPEDRFAAYALHRMDRKDAPGTAYRLSEQYSSLKGLGELNDFLEREDLDFLDAMQHTAMHLFIREATACRQDGRKLLLIEDGGYLAPVINRLCLKNKTAADAASMFHLSPPDGSEMPFSRWLDNLFFGSVEHTKNGYDYAHAVMAEFGRLQFPLCTIAVSELKRGVEANACAHVITNAVENILHRLGFVLANRKVLVLGSSGAIGSKMVRDLCRRFGRDHVYGVDIVPSAGNAEGFTEVHRLDELEESHFSDIDVIIGMIGASIMAQPFIEKLVLDGKKHKLFFASGSTKTVEFNDLERWVRALQANHAPTIGGRPIEITSSPVRDLQTGVLQGEAVTIRFLDTQGGEKTLYLLGGLTPINFLYYGIPRETMGDVMAQLLSVSAGLASYHAQGNDLPPRLLAVDHEIDADANLFKRL
jgi:hypothetical protein